MSVLDPIADMLTRIRNASAAGLDKVQMQPSRIKGEIARILKREGFVTDVTTEELDGRPALCVRLKYGANREPVLHGLRRISKSGLRRYVTADKIARVRGGMGIAILSTSGGVLTDREARQARLGGEVLCHIW